MFRAAVLTLALCALAGCGQANRLTASALPGAAPAAKAIGCLPGQCQPRPTPVPTCRPPRPLALKAICPPGECGTPKPTPCR